MQQKKNTLFILYFLLSFVLQAQTTSFIYYGHEQGLSQTQIQCITQDKGGNLWIGTISGLAKYNGKNFTLFTKADSLAEDWITSLYKDKNSNIWIGHWAGGVSMYNYKTQKIENLFLEEYTQFKTVTAITQDKENRYWIATEGAGVFIYDPISDKMGTITTKDGLSSDNVYALCSDPKGNMWIGTDIGITIFDISTVANHSILNIGNGLHSNRITAMQLINKNEMWIGSADKGVMVLKVNDKFEVKNPYTSIDDAGYKITSNEGLGSDFVNCITETQAGEVWIGTTAGGAAKIIPFVDRDRKKAITNALIYNYSTRQGLNYFNANAIYEDIENNIWIGTDIGLNQYRGERFQIFDEADNLVNNLVWTTLCDSDGNIWLGTNNGISKITFSKSSVNNKQTHVIKNYTTSEGLRSNVIMSSYEDSKGNVWFGSGFGGVTKFDKATGSIQNYTKENGLASDIVYSICEDPQGNMWFGTKEGVTKLDKQSNTFRSYSIADGLGGNNVYKIFKDSKNRIWFGALGGSLSVFDGTSFKRFTEADGMYHRFILSINEDKNNNLWFGAYGGGLYKYNGKKFTHYTTKDGLAGNTPYSIIADNNNNIWIGTSKGIDKFNTNNNTFFHYGKTEGFLGVETNPNAVCMDKEGNLWYGTIMGAVKYNINEDKPNKVSPQTIITGMKLFMKESPFPDDAEFRYDQNHITFTFLGVGLTFPQKIKYNYKLEGFDKDWLPVTTSNNEAVYANLPAGKYTFLVKSCNSDGVWNEKPVEYKFFVKPPFWQTAFFYILVVVFAIFGLYVYDKMRTRKLKNATKKLEEKVNERTEELAAKNAELGSKNKEITDSILYAKKIQDAVLVPESMVKTIFTDSFIYNNPKDIVSGDFYWIDKKNEYIIFAVADCTGHGVPGGFMSVIAYNALTNAVNTVQKINAAQILYHLNKIMSETLKQTTRVKDGLDIALCVLNTNTNELQFAGAYCPLFIMKENEFIEIKGDNATIGVATDGNYFMFKNHHVQLSNNDVIYLFTDGYVDQYGGVENKKLGTDMFRSILSGAQLLPMEQQKELLTKTMKQWLSNSEQADDMLIMGIRVQTTNNFSIVAN